MRLVMCGKCGRAFYKERDDPDAWLIKPDIRYAPEHKVMVVRCPQHVTVWALRCAGLGRSKSILRHYFIKSIDDDEVPRSDNPYVEPIPIDLLRKEDE